MLADVSFHIQFLVCIRRLLSPGLTSRLKAHLPASSQSSSSVPTSQGSADTASLSLHGLTVPARHTWRNWQVPGFLVDGTNSLPPGVAHEPHAGKCVYFNLVNILTTHIVMCQTL